jgi:hypothetical protein
MSSSAIDAAHRAVAAASDTSEQLRQRLDNEERAHAQQFLITSTQGTSLEEQPEEDVDLTLKAPQLPPSPSAGLPPPPDAEIALGISESDYASESDEEVTGLSVREMLARNRQRNAAAAAAAIVPAQP